MTTREAGRIAALPSLPVFLKLQDRTVLIAGGTEAAVWKAELISAAGARIVVCADILCAGLKQLAADLGAERLIVRARAWEMSDLDGIAVALGAIDDDAEAERFACACQAAGVLVNVIDKPRFCDFQFGTLVERSPLVIAIGTDGAAPVFGQAIRARIEAMLPDPLRAWAAAAKEWRVQLQALDLPFWSRRRFWERFSERALANPDREPSDADRAACFSETQKAQASPKNPTVTLVGCGSGEIGDVTFAAVRALQSAEVLLFDSDVSVPVVSLTRREAAKYPVGDCQVPNAEVLRAIQSVRRIAWLGTGNPATSPRWLDRAKRLETEGFAWEIVEGLDRHHTSKAV